MAKMLIPEASFTKNNRRLQEFFDRKTGGCVVGHVTKLFRQKNTRSRLLFFVKLASGPDQVPHFRHGGRDVSRSGISTDCHV